MARDATANRGWVVGDRNDVSGQAAAISIVAVVLAGAAMGWLVGGDVNPRWSDTASGAIYAACLFIGLVVIFSFQIDEAANRSGDLMRALKVQVPWILLTAVVVGWVIDAGRGIQAW
jgi:uncharacterized membrane protein YbjE (DUF340 family)